MSKQVLTQTFHTRTEAIRELHHWYICPECGAFTQPYRLKETAPPLSSSFERTYTLGCGHRFESLSRRWRVFRAIEGGHNAETFLTFETKERDGHQSEQMTQWGKSFLVAYYNILANIESNNVTADGSQSFLPTLTDTGGTARTFVTNANPLSHTTLASQAGAGVNAEGMQVGTGSAANTGTTSALGALIAHGTAAGQLSYGAMGITAPAGSAPLSCTFTRTLTNGSGAAITINEVGLAILEAVNQASAVYANFLLVRDLTGGVTVNNGANTTGTYTLQYTIS